MNDAALITGTILILALISVGIYFIFYKRSQTKTPPIDSDFVNYVNKLAINDEAKQIHLRELRKQTAKPFSKLWFLEYWHGKRSLFYAFWTWCFLFPLLLGIITAILFITLTMFNPSPSFANAIILLTYILKIFLLFIGMIIVWRCAKNSSTFWKYIGRTWAILNLLSIVLTILNLVDFIMA